MTWFCVTRSGRELRRGAEEKGEGSQICRPSSPGSLPDRGLGRSCPRGNPTRASGVGTNAFECGVHVLVPAKRPQDGVVVASAGSRFPDEHIEMHGLATGRALDGLPNHIVSDLLSAGRHFPKLAADPAEVRGPRTVSRRRAHAEHRPACSEPGDCRAAGEKLSSVDHNRIRSVRLDGEGQHVGLE